MADGCERADVSWSPVGRPEDLQQHEQLVGGNGLLNIALDTARQAVTDQTLLPGMPLEFGDSQRSGINSQPPPMGADTRAILESLGYEKHIVEGLLAEQKIAVCD